MFKNMKLGTKIGLGFGVLITLACLLGGLAIMNMKKAQAQSNMLAYEYIPEVDLGGNISLCTQKTMLGMRSYALSEDEAYLADAQKNMAETKKWIGECQALADKSEHLTKIKGSVDTCNQHMTQYEQLSTKTAEGNRLLAQNRQKLDAAAQELVKNTEAFVASQNEAFKKDLADGQQKMRLAGDLAHTGEEARTLSFKSLVYGKSEITEQAIAQLDAMAGTVTQLQPFAKETEDAKKLEQVDKAVKQYRAALSSCLAEQKKGTGPDPAQLEKIRQEMDDAAANMTRICAGFQTEQQEALDSDIAERHHKITLINDAIDLTSATRLACFKGQATNDMKVIRDAEANFPKMDEKLDELRKITRMAEDLQAIDKTKVAAQAYRTEMQALLANKNSQDQLTTERGKVGDLLVQAADELSSAGAQNTTAISQAAAQSLSVSSTVMVIGLAITLVVGIVVAVFITRSITGPIRRIIASLTEGSEQVSAASTQVSAASQSLAEGATEQAAGLEETSSSLEEMSSMTKQNSDNAQQANILAV
ncbi:MAG: MCP four helix bundle domain-containing protein, partial [Phycisphaerales bacterium]